MEIIAVQGPDFLENFLPSSGLFHLSTSQQKPEFIITMIPVERARRQAITVEQRRALRRTAAQNILWSQTELPSWAELESEAAFDAFISPPEEVIAEPEGELLDLIVKDYK
ncbi:hypothetical protein QQZ08_007467 [Neonectria magnoliae]|uniref:Uncharacterized protein n=1 Tax=Neonectria magnoliae TaxID=2732573 RepID=A0ABR1HYZ2_9HYPO